MIWSYGISSENTAMEPQHFTVNVRIETYSSKATRKHIHITKLAIARLEFFLL